MNTDEKSPEQILPNQIQQPITMITHHDQMGYILGNERIYTKINRCNATHNNRQKLDNHLNQSRKSIWHNSILFHDKNNELQREGEKMTSTK